MDPIAGDFVSWSPYNYTLNNPSGTVDPDGRDPVTITVIAISFGIGAFIGAVAQERRNIEEGRPPGEGVFRAALIGGTIAATGEFVFTLAAGDASAGVLTAGAGAVAADVEAAAVPAFARSVGARGVAAADGAAVGGGSQTAAEIGVTRHGVAQKINRGVRTVDELEAIKSPLDTRPVVIDKLGRPSQRVVGRNAEVVRNPESGEIVSVNPTSTKKSERLLRRKEDQ